MKKNRMLTGVLASVALSMAFVANEAKAVETRDGQVSEVVKSVAKEAPQKPKDTPHKKVVAPAAAKETGSTVQKSATIVTQEVITNAAAPSVASDVKHAIGSVDVYKIFQSSEQAREDEKRIMTECETRKKGIEDSYGRLRKIQEELQAMKNTAVESAQEKKLEEGRELQKSIEIKTQGLQEYQTRASQEAQMRILREVEIVTEEVRKERGLVIVVAGGTLAVDPSIDISNVVVDRMNKKYCEKKQRQAAPSRIVS